MRINLFFYGFLWKEFKRILKKDKKDHNSEGLTRLIKMGKLKGWDKKYKQTY